jgi:uncharacterized protein YggE
VGLHPLYSEAATPASAPEVIGYTAINNVEVRVRELDQLGDLMDTAVSAGGNTISGVRFTIGETADLQDQARQAAVEDAREKAEKLADLAGVSLGPVLSISEGGVSPMPVFGADIGLGGGGALPVEPGAETVSVTVQVTWVLTD